MLCKSLIVLSFLQSLTLYDRHTTVTLGFHHDEVAFAEEARRHARKHGSKSREAWKYDLLDIDQDDEDNEEEDDEDDEDDDDEYEEDRADRDFW